MSDIYNIINKEKLDIVSKPIKDAHGLPNEGYTSKEYTLIERKKLFEDKWMVIGVASSLPNVGDAKPVDILGMPILLVRGKDKKIDQLNKDNKWKEIEFFKSDYIASKDVNAWLGLYEVIK